MIIYSSSYPVYHNVKKSSLWYDGLLEVGSQFEVEKIRGTLVDEFGNDAEEDLSDELVEIILQLAEASNLSSSWEEIISIDEAVSFDDLCKIISELEETAERELENMYKKLRQIVRAVYYGA